VYEIDDAFVGVEVTAVNDETVGAVVSRVIVGPSAIAAGPVLPAASVAPFAAKCGMIVPAEQLVSVTVRVAPVSAPGANTQPVAVPVCVKSPAATPVTDSAKVTVYENDAAFVGDAWALVKVDTVGAVVSITIAFAPAMLFVPVGTVVDVIALPAVSATVPIVKLDTVRSAEFCAAATV
jgi:hypothetical protein